MEHKYEEIFHIGGYGNMNHSYAPFTYEIKTVQNEEYQSFALVSETSLYDSALNQSVLEGLAARFFFLELGKIGTSVMGKDIPYVKIGRGPKEVCYQAAIHANEWITTPVLLKFVEEYATALADSLTGRGSGVIGNVPAQLLYEDYSLYVIPMVNPDGVDLVQGKIQDEVYLSQAQAIASAYPEIPFPDGWKANIDGIDLNLQFPAGWEDAREIKFSQGFTSPAPRDYVGTQPLEAPESRALYEFTRAHDFQLILAYHTQGEVIYWKYRDYEPEGSRRIANYFGYVSGYTVEETPYASGNAGYKDWFIQDYNRPGYTIEVGLGVNPLPMTQFAQIYEVNKGILIGGMTEI